MKRTLIRQLDSRARVMLPKEFNASIVQIDVDGVGDSAIVTIRKVRVIPYSDESGEKKEEELLKEEKRKDGETSNPDHATPDNS